MAGKKNRQKHRAKQARQNTPPTPNKSLLRDNEILKKVFSSLFYFAGSMVAVYELINYFRSDAKTFTSLILPGLIGIIWLVVLAQMFRRGNSYAYVLLAITVVGGVVGGIGWRSYNQTQEDKVIVLVAQFDGPEETYGLHQQIMEDLRQATKGYNDTTIIDGQEVVTAGQGSEYARELGKNAKADLVIWAWYRPTENPNITVHFENLSNKQILSLRESEIHQPTSTLAALESFEIQEKLGSETSTMIVFLTGLLRYEAGDYQTALERFDQSLQSQASFTSIDPSSLHFYRGFSEYELGLFKDAVDDYDKVIKINPNLPEAYVNRGNAYDELALPERAIQDFNKAIELNPKLAAAYYNRGITYANLDQNDQAIRDFNEVIKIDPQYDGVYHELGLAYGKDKQYELAIEFFDKAIEINPLDARAYNDRGVAYSFLGQVQRAIQDFKKAIDLAPNLADAYYNRGIAYGNLRQYKEALQDFNKTIEMDSHYADAYRDRGIVYRVLGSIAESEADFKKYEELTGEKP